MLSAPHPLRLSPPKTAPWRKSFHCWLHLGFKASKDGARQRNEAARWCAGVVVLLGPATSNLIYSKQSQNIIAVGLCISNILSTPCGVSPYASLLLLVSRVCLLPADCRQIANSKTLQALFAFFRNREKQQLARYNNKGSARAVVEAKYLR